VCVCVCVRVFVRVRANADIQSVVLVRTLIMRASTHSEGLGGRLLPPSLSGERTLSLSPL
jgi:hypothetical protein